MSHRDLTLRMYVLPADECLRKGNELGPTIEEFARTHRLPLRWVELRNACSHLVRRADFWYRADLRDAARPPAVEASDILHASLGAGSRSAEGMSQPCQEDAEDAIRSDYESADCQTGLRKARELSVAESDEAYMRRAIALARIALANGDTPVGSLVVHKSKVIGEGFEAVEKQMDVQVMLN